MEVICEGEFEIGIEVVIVDFCDGGLFEFGDGDYCLVDVYYRDGVSCGEGCYVGIGGEGFVVGIFEYDILYVVDVGGCY